QGQMAGLTNELQSALEERDRATNALAALTAEMASLRRNPNEVLKLRGEVGKLRQENATIGSSSALSKLTADPASRKLLRDQQKQAMSMVYKSLARNLSLTPEQTEQFNDLLADHIMENVDQVTLVLRDKASPEEMDRIFAAQDAALQTKLSTLLGTEGATQYQDYTRKLLSSITTDQFKSMMTGDGDVREAKVKQMNQMLQEEVQSALSAAGLPADYQAVPMLNFRNIASEQNGERSIKLLDEIYQRFAARGSAFLSEEELAKFETFRAAAIQNNRAALSINRTVMAPIASK
ncbi:MAG TPA: hypothetical protein VN673_06130, partial [Clostridia bacterium]|nr:hypothetical protein [Clostridia bacterium]